MNPIFQEYELWAFESITALLVIAVIRLWISHFTFREEVAKTYVTKDQLTDLVAQQHNDIAAVKLTVESILRMVHEIRGSLHGIARE